MFSKVTQVGSIYQLPPSIESLQWCKIPPPDGNITSTDMEDKVTEFDRLLPTLVECFAIVICGFLAGRCHIISSSNIKGLSDFTTYFTLPPLIFLNLVTINLEHVNWLFILGILMGKVVVFFLVAFITAAVQRPTNFGYAGLYAIFCTQGNDFGLAYPIVASLYGGKRPLYPSYMYLIAPTSLIITNPIGFLLMEVEKIRTKKDFDPKAGIYKTIFLSIGSVSWAVIKNPVVFVTLLGIAGNFLFHGGLPSVVYGILQILSSAFSASVLFLLGFSVVGSGSSMSGAGLLIPGVLLITKMLASPLITRGTVALLCAGAPDVSDLSDYGFLYGMVPTGPIVMLFAAEYCLRTEMLASTMIVCTALFGPVMFVLARMFALKVKGMEEFSGELKQTMFVLSIVSFLSCVWIAMCLLLSKKWKHYVYKITLCLLVSQAAENYIFSNRSLITDYFLYIWEIIMAVGIFTWGMLPAEQDWIVYFQVIFITAGQLMSRVWTTLLAVSLVVKQRKPSSFFIQKLWYPLGFGFGFPAIIVIMLLIATSAGKCYPDLDRELPLFMYGYSEAIGAIVILFICLVITTSCLVLYYRSLKWSNISEGKCANRSSVEEPEPQPQTAMELERETEVKPNKNLVESTEFAIYKLRNATSESNVMKAANKSHLSGNLSEDDATEKNLWDFPQRLKSETSFSQSHLLSPAVSDNSCSSQSLDIVSMTSGSSNEQDDDDMKSHDIPRTRLRHVVLLILLCISIAVGLTISSWKLTTGHPNGLFVAMEFLDAVLNIGQGLFAFIVFIKDSKYILSPLANWLRKVRYGVYSLDIPSNEIDDLTRQQCRQFLTYHYNNCRRDLPKSVVYKHQNYSKSFTGYEFVDWLIRVGLAKNRSDGELYGQRLLRGGVLSSVNEAVQFHDNSSYIYRLKNENQY